MQLFSQNPILGATIFFEEASQDFRVDSFTLRENAKEGIPTITNLSVSGSDVLLVSDYLRDGSMVDLFIDDVRYRFAVFNYEYNTKNGQVEIGLSGYLGSSGLLAGDIRSYQGTASFVFNEVCDRLELEKEIDATNDSQVWIHSNTKLCRFLDDVCDHAWSSDTSCYAWTLTLGGLLRFYNLTERQYDRKYRLTNVPDPTSPKDIEILQSTTTSSKSGTDNYVGSGYNDTVNINSVIGRREFLNTVQVDTDLPLNISKPMITNLKQPTDIIDAGNCHSNYYKAASQNRRIKSLYNITNTYKINPNRSIKPLDYVEVVIEGDQSLQSSGFIQSSTLTYVDNRLHHIVAVSSIGDI